MAIAFACECGRQFSVVDAFAGKRTKCPACAAPLTVPIADPLNATATATAAPTLSEDEAFRVLAEGSEDEATRPAARYESDAAPASRPAPAPSPVAAKPRGPKLAIARKERAARPFDPEAARKVLYIVGGLLMMGGGGALAFYAVEGGGRFSIRGMVLGCMLVFAGIGVLFQGITGKFNDEVD